MRTSPSPTAIGSTLAFALLLVAGEGLTAPAAAEAATSCRVNNVSQGTFGRSLIRMVERSHDGEKLFVRGTCAGEVVIATDIVIVGRGRLVPIITGRDKTRVLRVKRGAIVVLRRLRIEHGKTAHAGGGIWTAGRLTLRNVVLRRNRARYGGGIHINPGGRARLIATSVWGNIARGGGGIHNFGTARLTASSVSGNKAGRGHGGGVYSQRRRIVSDRLTVTDSTISDNASTGNGGGLFSLFGTVTLVRTTVSGNTGRDGGGIASVDDSFTLRGVTVRDNAAETDGGGIQALRDDLTITDSMVTGNNAGEKGGGIHVVGRVTITDSTVTENSAVLEGGGIYAYDAQATLTLKGSSSVHDNVPDDCVGTTAC